MVESELKKENVQVPFIKDDGRIKLKKQVEDRRGELVLLINDLGFFKARRLAKSLAEKYEVSYQMIYKDFDWIKGHLEPIDLREIKIDLRIGRSRAYSEALDLLVGAKNGEDKIKAINAVILAGKHYREELEAWGEKEKMPDKHQFEAMPTTFNIIEKSVEEIKDARKNARAGSEPEATGNPESS